MPGWLIITMAAELARLTIFISPTWARNYSPTYTMRYSILLFLLFASLTCPSAQTEINKVFEWTEGYRNFVWEGERFVEYDFKVAVPERGSNVVWPLWIETFPVDGPGQLNVTVQAVEYGDLVVAPGTDLSRLSEDLTFSTSIVRTPAGWMGKISCLPIIRGVAGTQRLENIRLRIDREATARPRSVLVDDSVLSDGEVYQFAVTGTGMYKLTRGFLTDELGINLDNIDPRTLKLYGQEGGMLPLVATDPAPDDLIEQPVFIEGEGDGNFDGGDYIVFYAEGPDRWNYDENQQRFDRLPNLYTTENYYYLKVGAPGNGRRITAQTETGGTTVTSFDDLYRYERESDNVLHLINQAVGSGQIWFGDFFKGSRERDYNRLFEVPDLVGGENAIVRARMALRSGPTSANGYFYVEVNGEEIRSNLGSGVNYNSVLTQRAVSLTSLNGNLTLNDGQVDVKVRYPIPGNAFASEAWLDYVQLRVRRQLRLAGDQLSFRDTRTQGQSNLSLQLANATESTQIWRVGTGNSQRLNGNFSGGTLTVGAATGGELREFVAFNPNADLLTPRAVGRVENQNLHAVESADMLIVTHPDFRQQAEDLAEHRRNFSGLEVVVASTEEVYHEFSSGKDDPSAIRNFAKMIFDRDPDFRYLLIVGDGSFDHRDIYGLGTNFVPVFEHQGDFNEVDDFPADDFYGIFTSSPNRLPLDPDLNVSVGRLPVRSASQAGEVVRKIIQYDLNPQALGDWRTRLVFVGDDEDAGRHTDDVDLIARRVGERKPELNFDKLYFDIFPQISLSSGDRFPEITQGLDRSVVRGALAITYLGHGGPRGWAQERVLTIPQIRNWRNPDHLPIFITATCTFAAYDDSEFVSAGEETLLSDRGGAAALLTTTRPVFATQNAQLTNATLQALIDRPDGRWRTLGEVILIAKNAITARGFSDRLNSNTENARKFTLLGDPAMVVALPTNGVVTTQIDAEPVDAARIDTVGALDRITISGEVVDVSGQLMEDFSGLVYPTVYDKPQTIQSLQQDPGSPDRSYEVQRNIIFRGRATVTNGRFSFTFVVPRDINYEFGRGKISYYAADPGTKRDAAGFYDQLVIGGTSRDTISDEVGPEVGIFFDDESFMSGDEVGTEALLLVKLRDDLGINVAGNSIGHDLEATFDEDTRTTIVLNDYYEANPDDFRSGEVRFRLFDLEPGLHTVSVRAWDVANNSSVSTTEFVVAADGREGLTHVLNYPNPFTDRTCFQFDHTLVNEEVDVIIQVYTVSGRLVRTIRENLPFSDGSLRLDDCIEWDGTDDYGDQLARGTYLYQVRLRGEEQTIQGDFQKLVILK